MEFPDLLKEKEKLVDTFCRDQGLVGQEIKVIASPYRVSPIGAHIDHQGGPVLGMAINAYTLMAYIPSDDGQIKLRSQNFSPPVEFDLHHIPAPVAGDWGNYARGATRALKNEFKLKRGVTGLLKGTLPGCGLSSSASVILCYLHALAEANEIELAAWDYVRLNQSTENDYLSLKNGILDQTTIVFGQRQHLLHIDTREKRVNAIRDGQSDEKFRILIAYSGYCRQLTATGYNSRVYECQQAAADLARLDGLPPATRLSDVPELSFQRHGPKLAPHLYRRASHYFSEVRRVQQGLSAWKDGQIKMFGQLMSDSCQSSIGQYECGSPVIQGLQQIVSSTTGVIGSRFSGGGYAGCVVGLVEPKYADAAIAEIEDTYLERHPEVKGKAAFYLAYSANGVGFL